MLAVGAMESQSVEAQLTAPTGLIATPGNGQVTLSWQSVSGAASYNIYYGTTSGGEAFAYNESTNMGSSAITGLVIGATYYFEVTATNSNGESAKSSEVNATPVSPNSLRVLPLGDSITVMAIRLLPQFPAAIGHPLLSVAGQCGIQRGLCREPDRQPGVVFA